jgi:hypothetical protein
MIVFFLPNGIGDTLMAIPALRRLVNVRGVDSVAVVVSSRLHTQLLHRFIDPGMRAPQRYGGQSGLHMRVSAGLLALRAEVMCAPILSRKPLHTAFFASLLKRIQVPDGGLRHYLLVLGR